MQNVPVIFLKNGAKSQLSSNFGKSAEMRALFLRFDMYFVIFCSQNEIIFTDLLLIFEDKHVILSKIIFRWRYALQT